jgi:hypothetical protein
VDTVGNAIGGEKEILLEGLEGGGGPDKRTTNLTTEVSWRFKARTGFRSISVS